MTDQPTRSQIEEAIDDVVTLADGSEPESLEWLTAAAGAVLSAPTARWCSEHDEAERSEGNLTFGYCWKAPKMETETCEFTTVALVPIEAVSDD